jgi:hypothetical protein
MRAPRHAEILKDGPLLEPKIDGWIAAQSKTPAG